MQLKHAEGLKTRTHARTHTTKTNYISRPVLDIMCMQQSQHKCSGIIFTGFVSHCKHLLLGPSPPHQTPVPQTQLHGQSQVLFCIPSVCNVHLVTSLLLCWSSAACLLCVSSLSVLTSCRFYTVTAEVLITFLIRKMLVGNNKSMQKIF